MNQEKLRTIFIDTFVYLFTEIMKDKGYINCLKNTPQIFQIQYFQQLLHINFKAVDTG